MPATPPEHPALQLCIADVCWSYQQLAAGAAGTAIITALITAYITWCLTKRCRIRAVGWEWQRLQDPEDADAAATWRLVPSSIPTPRRQDGWGDQSRDRVEFGHARLSREGRLNTPRARDLAAVVNRAAREAAEAHSVGRRPNRAAVNSVSATPSTVMVGFDAPRAPYVEAARKQSIDARLNLGVVPESEPTVRSSQAAVASRYLAQVQGAPQAGTGEYTA